MSFKEHDVVRATANFTTHNIIGEGVMIRKGMEGTVVRIDGLNCVISFSEIDGTAIIHKDYLEAIHKKYLCVWGTGYNGVDKKAIVKNMDNADSFSDDNGYNKEAIWKINSLMIGQCADLTDLSGFHYVIRVE